MSALETATQLNEAGPLIEALRVLNELSGASFRGMSATYCAELLERVADSSAESS